MLYILAIFDIHTAGHAAFALLMPYYEFARATPITVSLSIRARRCRRWKAASICLIPAAILYFLMLILTRVSIIKCVATTCLAGTLSAYDFSVRRRSRRLVTAQMAGRHIHVPIPAQCRKATKIFDDDI